MFPTYLNFTHFSHDAAHTGSREGLLKNVNTEGQILRITFFVNDDVLLVHCQFLSLKYNNFIFTGLLGPVGVAYNWLPRLSVSNTLIQQ